MGILREKRIEKVKKTSFFGKTWGFFVKSVEKPRFCGGTETPSNLKGQKEPATVEGFVEKTRKSTKKSEKNRVFCDF